MPGLRGDLTRRISMTIRDPFQEGLILGVLTIAQSRARLTHERGHLVQWAYSASGCLEHPMVMCHLRARRHAAGNASSAANPSRNLCDAGRRRALNAAPRQIRASIIPGDITRKESSSNGFCAGTPSTWAGTRQTGGKSGNSWTHASAVTAQGSPDPDPASGHMRPSGNERVRGGIRATFSARS